MEHRWGTRHPLDVSVRLAARPHLLAFARLRNASSSGAYLVTRAALPLMTRIHVELGWGEFRRGEPHRIPAYVVRADGVGVGLEWCDFAPMPILELVEREQRPARVDWRPSAAAFGAPNGPAHGIPAYGIPTYRNPVTAADRLLAEML